MGRAVTVSSCSSEDSADLADYSSRREEKLKDIAASLTRPRPTRTLSFLQSIEHSKVQPPVPRSDTVVVGSHVQGQR